MSWCIPFLGVYANCLKTYRSLYTPMYVHQPFSNFFWAQIRWWCIYIYIYIYMGSPHGMWKCQLQPLSMYTLKCRWHAGWRWPPRSRWQNPKMFGNPCFNEFCYIFLIESLSMPYGPWAPTRMQSTCWVAMPIKPRIKFAKSWRELKDNHRQPPTLYGMRWGPCTSFYS